MIKTINIYLKKDYRQQLEKIQQKYKVSRTTIVDKLIFVTYYALLHYGTRQNLNEELKKEYFEKGQNKTSIKTPRCMRDKQLEQALLNKDSSKYITNALILYITKNIKMYLTNEGLNYYWNTIDQKLTKETERYWDYNNFVRSSRRNLKENKEYYKKAIKEMEHKEK